ncbi:MAG TPA: hypothetical protein VFV58_18110 [Blastocatellia bacterium]|nr:hypothetical protein [Blastocatellia bacterium]
MIADDLHQSTVQKDVPLSRYFTKLDEVAPLGCIVSGNQAPDLSGVYPPPHYVYIPRSLPARLARLREKVIDQLKVFGRLMPAPIRLPNLSFSPGDRALREQIRGLSDHRSLDDGMEILQHLIRWFFKGDEVMIERLGQGLSGAKVFLIRIGAEKEAKSYVIKLGSEASLWKLEQEVKKHEQATNRIGAGHYRRNLPLLHPCLDSEGKDYIARYKNWAAVCYDYLGNSDWKGGIVDLETLMVCSNEELSRRTRETEFFAAYLSDLESLAEGRKRVFTEFLTWLCKEWYQQPGKVERRHKRLWMTEDCPPREYPVLPPYRLKGKEKGWILGFLEGRDAEKVAWLRSDWAEHRDRVGEFVERNDGKTGLPALDVEIPVILSPAHGDLNANNAILWLHHPDQHFLIDFPFFQESGHAMQDFARLEVEIVFALMECQAESYNDLPARDHTYTQLPLWCEMADHLLTEDGWQGEIKWKSAGFKGNITQCFELIQLLRQKAKDIQQRQIDKANIPGFFEEYLPALLYYTLREIGYPSRTVFKRLLAVYSASQILIRLGQLTAGRF